MIKKNFIVVTSIFEPTRAIYDLERMQDWQLIVVGDRKTPKDWACGRARYLAVSDQVSEQFAIASMLPWNHYSRKMIGYIDAIRSGAHIIVDTDDDNIPKVDWVIPNFEGCFQHCDEEGFVNIYSYFSDDLVWPRGFPLRYVLHPQKTREYSGQASVGVWQFLADEDPDVDAVYRMVLNKPIYFKQRPPLVLNRGAICPFNSQNTAFRKEVFPLLYLPAFVNFRFTDILRGLVAQPILWQFGYLLGFGEATVTQDRNPHDFMKDFVDEIPMYTHCEKIVEIVSKSIFNCVSIEDSLVAAYKSLVKFGVVEERELDLLSLWLEDLRG
jgi:hypothetical protein